MKKALLLFFIGSLFLQSGINAQDNAAPSFNFKNGLGIASPDSAFTMNIRFRIQNRAAFTVAQEDEDTWDVSAVDARVRRMRLRFEGQVYDPRLTYLIQLSFSRGDMDWDNSGVPNVLRDAMVFYKVSNKLNIALGQGKLPGNRQRVVSSGDQQFADRSIVNAALNIDRDFGFQFNYTEKTGDIYYILRGAVSSGEGRNSAGSDKGLCYTGRLELLPFGLFDRRGDYFEGDLAREKKPKLSLAGGLSFNDRSVRTGGQLGRDLYSPVDIQTAIFDGLFKYQGIALYGEYMQRGTPEFSPVTENSSGAKRYVFAGEGMLAQASYLFKSNYEIAARYALTHPAASIHSLEPERTNYTLGVTKYLKAHRVKLQSDVTYEETLNLSNDTEGKNWQFRFQVELGI